METGGLRGAKIGVIFQGSKGYVVLTSYTSGAAFDLDGKMVKKFSGGGDHFDNFIKAVRSRKNENLTADILQGHLSCALSHLGNVSYYMGKEASVADIRRALDGLKTNEDTDDALDRVTAHLADNKVDLKKTPLSLGPFLKLDPKSEQFIDNAEADSLLTRKYRAPFVVPAAGKV